MYSGSSAFVDLCELGALLRWSGSVHRLSDLERGLMKEYRVSPLIFWSNQKRAVRPLLAAGGDTLRALGALGKLPESNQINLFDF